VPCPHNPLRLGPSHTATRRSVRGLAWWYQLLAGLLAAAAIANLWLTCLVDPGTLPAAAAPGVCTAVVQRMSPALCVCVCLSQWRALTQRPCLATAAGVRAPWQTDPVVEQLEAGLPVPNGSRYSRSSNGVWLRRVVPAAAAPPAAPAAQPLSLPTAAAPRAAQPAAAEAGAEAEAEAEAPRAAGGAAARAEVHDKYCRTCNIWCVRSRQRAHAGVMATWRVCCGHACVCRQHTGGLRRVIHWRAPA
jgi:hypothetical protein